LRTFGLLFRGFHSSLWRNHSMATARLIRAVIPFVPGWSKLEQLAIGREVERGLAAPSAEVGHPKRPTIVTGHSWGAALATLFVMENDARHRSDVSSLCTFASARVGNLEFVPLFNQPPVDSWRIVNLRDVVPKLPLYIPGLRDYGRVDTAYPFNSFDFAKNNLLCRHTMERPTCAGSTRAVSCCRNAFASFSGRRNYR
jgi:pimeloyl-ACP methyl ester carboxylesterase